MPVWHETTRPYRESGELVVLGITQEQHRERCRLFAAWQGFDWPILWDPFNMTGSAVVPNVFALDEHGVVRARMRRPSELAAFLEQTYEAPDGEGATLRTGARPEPDLVECSEAPPDTLVAGYYDALSSLLGAESAVDAAVAAVERYVAAHPDDAAGHFRLGVARRLRADGDARSPGDFQGALDAWRAALARDPDQYIWRRRIQQYGPRLDKPYPFYDWAGTAVAELAQRGVEAPWRATDLTGAERAAPSREFEIADTVEPPDPDGAIRRDDGSWLALETAVAFDTSQQLPVARVHLAFRPERRVHWNNESEPLVVWIGDPDLPAGWSSERQLLRAVTHAEEVVSTETRRVDFELRLPEGAVGRHAVKGYALFYACEDEAGECVYLRRDFELAVTVPTS